MKKIVLAALAIAIMSGFAFAGQTVIVYGLVTSTNVYGNGQLPAGSWPASNDPNGNTLNFINANAAVNAISIFGGYMSAANATANNNQVNINISSASYIYGGYAYCYYDILGNIMASNNTVSIVNSVVTNSVYGGYAVYAPDGGDNATANNNSVTVTNGSKVTNNIYGGYADGVYYSVGGTGVVYPMSATANNNSVTIMDSTVSGNVYGGYIIVRHSNDYNFGNATGNTITVGGAAVLNSAMLYGGYIDTAAVTISGGNLPCDVWTDNTLNVKNSGMSVKGIYNFENLNFYLPSNMTMWQTMLTVANAVDITNSKIGIIVTGGTALNTGDTVVLIAATGGLTATGINTMTYGADAGSIAKIYHFEIGYNSNVLYATLTDEETNNSYVPQVNPQTKALSEGQLGGLAFLNQGVDLVAGSGMNSAISAGQNADSVAAFASVGAGSSKYETGSSVDVNGFSVIAGLSERIGDVFTAGIFFEGGNSNYNTQNSFNNAPSVAGSGGTNYYGAGFLGRYDIGNSWYGEASLRMGQTVTDFNSSDFVGTFNAGYETSAIYYGAHIGAGRINKLSEKMGLDLSAKLFYTHQGGDDVHIENDAISFDSANSARARIGGRLNYDVSKNFSPYLGAFLDYELGGKANATINGMAIDTPELTGATGIGELGVSLAPSGKLPLTIDLGVQGYAGKRQGAGGSLHAGFKF